MMLVDLAAVRQAKRRMAELLRAHPEIRERTAHWLAAGGQEETPMQKMSLNIKVDPAVLVRARKLIPSLAADPEYGPLLRASQAAVLRLALMSGLEALEKRWAKGLSHDRG